MNNPKIIRTNSNNIDFQELVKELDADLKIRDGEEHAFFAQYNKIDLINHVVVAYMNDEAVGCGAIKQYDDDTMEVKRMFVKPTNRGNGIATMVLKEVENWTKELDFSKCILETGIKQPEAIALYQKNNYTQIPNYEQYEAVESSVCFEKTL
ncbi:GNAT family N-acetyltransferase [Algoriella sp.]|uniref:GNAT family N-acetyltransferase n=1 Tax=Algoriella sp. TaxID=1872434 RepID=UPI002FCA1550